MTATPTRRRTTRARLATGALALLLLGGVAACGVDGEEADEQPTTTEVEATTTPDEDTDGTTTEPEDDPDDTTTTAPDDEPTDDDAQAYIDALTENVDQSDAVSVEQATCLAESWLDTLGLEELQDAGVEPEEFQGLDAEVLAGLDPDEDTASDLFDGYLDCEFDLVTQLSSYYTQGDELTTEEQACAEALLTEEAMRESYIADFFDEELTDDVVDQLEECFPDREEQGEDDSTTAETVTVPED